MKKINISSPVESKEEPEKKEMEKIPLKGKGLPNKELLRVEEAAEYFQVTDRTIYLWIDHGHLQAERIGPGKSIRITRESALNCRLVNPDRE